MLEFGVLGPLEVRRDGQPVALGAAKVRALLAMLLLQPNRVVTRDALIDGLWGGRAPPTAGNVLQNYVFNLRQRLAETPADGKELVVTRSPGYLLAVDLEAVDATRFAALAEQGRLALAGEQPKEAVRLLSEALDLWRGPAYADVADEHWAIPEIARLEELRVVARTTRAEAELALGSHDTVVAELEALVERHPLREKLRALLILALYRCGRQADALAAYQDARRALLDGLGLDPTPELQELERAVLRQDPSLRLEVRPSGHAAARRRLPVYPTPLVGREREVADVRALVCRPDVRLVTLTGAGGSGKTRVALATAWQLDDDFPDGVTFVRLAPLSDPVLVLGTIATALGVEEAGEASLFELVCERLHGRRELLLLDNFEQVVAAAPLVSELLASVPSLTILVTSRAALRLSGEHDYPVPPLELPDPAHAGDVEALLESPAVELFVRRAQAIRHDFAVTPANASDVAEICHRLDGLPLAIELAAAHVRLLSPRTMLDRLERRLALLTGGSSDAPARQKTLRATIDWSYRLLDEPERAVFRHASVFVGGFDLEAAEAVCDRSAVGGDVLDALDGLLEKSLVYRATFDAARPRLSMLATIREYADELLADPFERSAARGRHAICFLDLAERAEAELVGADQAAWFDRLERDLANLRAALGFFGGDARFEEVAMLAGALGRFWLARGHVSEGRRWCERALADADLPAPARLKALLGTGPLAFQQAAVQEAWNALDEARRLAAELGDSRAFALSLTRLGYIARDRGELGEARELGEAAVQTARLVRDGWLVGVSLMNLANTVYEQGDTPGAMRSLQESADTFRDTGDRHNYAVALDNLGEIAALEGKHEIAQRALEESLAVSVELGAPGLVAHARGYLGLCHLTRNAASEAAELLREALPEAHRLGDRREVVNFVRMLAGVAVLQGDLRRGARLWGAASTLGEEAGIEAERQLLPDWCTPGPGPELGEAEFAAEFERGRTLTADEAVAYAVEAGERHRLAS